MSRLRAVVVSLGLAVATAPVGVAGASDSTGHAVLVPETIDVAYGVLSADGGTVAYTALVTDPATGVPTTQVFARDLAGGTITGVSVTTNGALASGDSAVWSVSADGRFVAFTSLAADVVVGDDNGVFDVFVRDVGAGRTTRVSVGPGGAEAAGESRGGYLSADGQRVAFTSKASNLVQADTNGARDVFVHDLSDRTTHRVSVTRSGQQSTVPTAATSMSADGQHISFMADSAGLVRADAPHRFSVFVHDLATAHTERVSVDRRGGTPDGRSVGGSLSANGRFVVFHSPAADLVPDDGDDDWDVFVRDRRRDRTEQVSLGRCGRGTALATWDGAVSDDGRYVAFSARTGGCIRDRRADRNLLLGARTSDLTIAGQARLVTFPSFNPLVPEDTNRRFDLYVAPLR